MLEPLINEAAMVVSHCGAGILLESLRSESKPMIFGVVNTSLMNDH